MIQVKWEVEDGHAGPARPQSSKVHVSDFDQDATFEEIKKELSEIISEDFRQNITWYGDLDGPAQEIFDALQASKE